MEVVVEGWPRAYRVEIVYRCSEDGHTFKVASVNPSYLESIKWHVYYGGERAAANVIVSSL